MLGRKPKEPTAPQSAPEGPGGEEEEATERPRPRDYKEAKDAPSGSVVVMPPMASDVIHLAVVYDANGVNINCTVKESALGMLGFFDKLTAIIEARRKVLIEGRPKNDSHQEMYH